MIPGRLSPLHSFTRGDDRRCSTAIARARDGISNKTSRLSLTEDDADGRVRQEQDEKERY